MGKKGKLTQQIKTEYSTVKRYGARSVIENKRAIKKNCPNIKICVVAIITIHFQFYRST